MRLSVPVLTSMRGQGLGNEVISWGKAISCAMELGGRALHPAWGLNRRDYWRDFSTSRVDWSVHQALRVLPGIDVEEFPKSFDSYSDYIKSRRSELEGHRIIWHSSGMAGGYRGIAEAREPLRAEFLRPLHVRRSLFRSTRNLDANRLNVALHVRQGDFEDSSGPGPGEFNKRIPESWFRRVVEDLCRTFGPRLQLSIFSDSDVSFDEVVSHGASLHGGGSESVLSDVMMMADADLLVCSVSSLSMLAAFFSKSNYVWYEPQLGERDGRLSIWGHEERNVDRAWDEKEERHGIQRGYAVGVDGLLPDTLKVSLEQTLCRKQIQSDLIMYGEIPAAK